MSENEAHTLPAPDSRPKISRRDALKRIASIGAIAALPAVTAGCNLLTYSSTYGSSYSSVSYSYYGSTVYGYSGYYGYYYGSNVYGYKSSTYSSMYDSVYSSSFL